MDYTRWLMINEGFKKGSETEVLVATSAFEAPLATFVRNFSQC